MDRADVAGSRAQLWTVALASEAVVAGWLLLSLRATRRNRAVLVVSAIIAATLAPVATGVTGPDEFDPVQLRTPATLTAALLVAIALMSALAAAPRIARSSLALATGVAVAFGLLLAVRPSPPQSAAMTSFFGMAFIGGSLIVTTAALGSGMLPGRPAFGENTCRCSVRVVFAYPFLFLFALVLTVFVVPVADPFTDFVGNPKVDAADSDHLSVVMGLLVGLTYSAALHAPGWLRRYAAAHPIALPPRPVDRETGLAAWMIED